MQNIPLIIVIFSPRSLRGAAHAKYSVNDSDFSRSLRDGVRGWGINTIMKILYNPTSKSLAALVLNRHGYSFCPLFACMISVYFSENSQRFGFSSAEFQGEDM
jgi:hypothetical protein